MKIISGSKKSHVISAPKNLPVRPTSGLVKESLFNILSNYFNFNKVKVLDLFAGTGNISYEFVSRGCKNIDSIDINSRCTRFIKKKSLELGLKINVSNLSVNRFLNKNQSKYDIIFADPPYQFSIEEYTDLIDLIFDPLLRAVVLVYAIQFLSKNSKKITVQHKLVGEEYFIIHPVLKHLTILKEKNKCT